MENITANGLTIVVSALPSFPNLVLTQFADDADPLDIPDIDISDAGMGVNGDLVTWATPKPIEVSISVISGSTDDKNLSILFGLNRAGKLKPSTSDLINMTFYYAGTLAGIGRKATMLGGRCKAYSPASGAQSSGRKKSKTYKFVFENAG